jgi:hypothetical protein
MQYESTQCQPLTDQQLLDAWRMAAFQTSLGQSYSVFGRMLTRANSAEILTQIRFWEERVAQSQGYTNTTYATMNNDFRSFS